MFSLIGLLFTSCSRFSTISVAKRHYRNGYYVEAFAQNPVKKQETKPSTMPTLSTNKNQSNTTSQNSISLGKGSKTITEVRNDIVNQVNNKKSDKRLLFHPAIPSSEFSLLNKVVEPVGNTLLKKEIIKLRHRDDGERHHALGGFLWFLIVFLLILFLLNFILSLNLGGLVYIILVVAVILLLFRLIGML